MWRTGAQEAALVKARQAKVARRTCQRCGFVAPPPCKRRWVTSIEKNGWCRDCNRKAEVEAWALKLIASEFIVVDTETTGLDSNSEVIEIAIVSGTGAILLNSLIKPQGPNSSEAQKIHRITDEELTTAPLFSELWPQISAILRRFRTFVGYNARFDVWALQDTAARYGLRLPGRTVPELPLDVKIRHRYNNAMSDRNDIMIKFAEWYSRNSSWRRLIDACHELGVELPTHRALNDALASLHVVRALAENARKFPQPNDIAPSRSHKRRTPTIQWGIDEFP